MITRSQLRRLILEQVRQSVPLLSVGEDPTNPDHSYEARMGADEKWRIYVISGGEDITEEMKAAGATIYTKKFSTPDEARSALANIIGSPMNESLKITNRQLRKIINEELRLIMESPISFSKVFKIADNAVKAGSVVSNSAVDGLFKASLNMGADEVQDRIRDRVFGLTAIEGGLVGLAIGVPALFFDEYSNAQKGDEMARFMAKSLRRPIEMRDILDPRDPGNRDAIVSQGGSLKSNPILYLASQENTNTAAELFDDEIIAKDVFKVIHELHQEKLRAVKQLKTMKSQSSNEEEDDTDEELTS